MKQIIWSSDALLDETAREYYQNFKREELDDDAYKVGDEEWSDEVYNELGDEWQNLNKDVNEVIIAFGDLDLWNGRNGYPRNNYSGLNSLRARLKNRHWNGKSPLEGQAMNGNGRSDSLQHRQDSVPGLGIGQFENLPDSTLADYAVRMQSGQECIGAPIFFFLNSARRT